MNFCVFLLIYTGFSVSSAFLYPVSRLKYSYVQNKIQIISDDIICTKVILLCFLRVFPWDQILSQGMERVIYA